MIKAGRDLAFCGAVGSQFVSNDAFGHEATTFHQLDQKPLCRVLVAFRLKDLLKNDAMLINRAPEAVGSARDLHNDFVHMPDIAGAWLPSPQAVGDEGAKLDECDPKMYRNTADYQNPASQISEHYP